MDVFRGGLHFVSTLVYKGDVPYPFTCPQIKTPRGIAGIEEYHKIDKKRPSSITVGAGAVRTWMRVSRVGVDR